MHQQRLKSKTDLVTLVAYGLATISAITAFAVASSNLTSSLFNFTLSNSGDIVVNVGDKVKNIISAKLISGKRQLIYFRTLNLPPGIKAIFSNKSCIPSCSTTLTLSTAGASEGRYPITVEGYKDKVVKQTTFYLTLIKKGDFVFKLTNDGDKKIPQGETAISNITVNTISGKPSAVELELNKYPAGLEYKFDPPSCTPLENLGGQCKAKLYLYSGQVKAGNYGIEVKGLNQNGKQATTAFTLIIKEPDQFDFSITDDGDKEVAIGKSVMSTITVKVLYGQPKPVMFKLESPNKYLTGSFSPTGCTPEPITNSCQSILTITAHEGIETNTTYDLTVTAQTSNLLSRSTIVRVKVNDVSVNNFGITTLGDTGISLSSKTPPTKSLEQYYAMNAVFVNLEIPAKGYEEFTFSAQGIPSGIRYWFEPTKCRINKGEKTCGTVMRYTISGDAKKGSYTIETVARSSNGGEARNKFKLNVRIDENNNTDYVLYPEEKSTTISPTDNDQSRPLQNFNIVAELLNAFDNYGQKDVYINGYIIPNLPEGTSLVKHNLDNTWSKVSFENWLIKTSNQYQWWLDYSVNTIKVTEPSLVKEGKYDLIIVGKSGELVRTTRKEVIIVTPPAVSDFTLKVTYPATFKDNIIEVKQDGKSDYFTATLQTIIGAPGEVSLKVNPYYLNNGKISVVFEPSSSCYLNYRDTVNSSCERKARVYAEKNTTPGDYQLLLQAQSSQTYHDEILKVRVKQAATTTPPSSGGGGGGTFGPIRP